ncbi:unnamed protein product [Orchesella dallaii]|uniref:Uncharacterized protein n=1 Tax=Orchesella dallaii TaxID=48710 RepID=A0ABP1RYD1_9HEXA
MSKYLKSITFLTRYESKLTPYKWYFQPQQEKRGSKVSLVAAEPQAWMVDVEAGGSGSGESSAKLSKSENDTGIKNEDKFSETLVVQTDCDDDSPKDIGSPENSESVNNSIGVDNSVMDTSAGGNITDDVKNESLPG